MKILAVDTSSLIASAALIDGDVIVFEGNLSNGHTHCQSLMPLIEAAMNLAGWQPSDVEGLAVTDGPGSFTGLRIGMATVKGLARKLAVPVAAVSTLHVLAEGCAPVGGLIVPVMDARREQVYTATFAGGPAPRRMTPDRTVGLDALIGELLQSGEDVLFTGDGTGPYGEALLAGMDGRGRIAPPPMRMQRAAVAGLIGARQIAGGNAPDPRTLTPRYLRGTLSQPIWDQQK